MPSRKRNPVRRPRGHRPQCTPLEDRHLLSVTLTETAPAVQYVGSPVTWTATSSGEGSTPVYQFSVAAPGGRFQVVNDFSPSNSFTWNPMQEGSFKVRVVVEPKFGAKKSESTTTTYTALTRVVGDNAVVSPMANPLVALFSAPPSPGASMYVQFAQQGPSLSWQNTSPLPIVPGTSTNFIVAGMQADTTYLMRYVLDDGTISAPVSFTTGTPPANVKFPTFTVVQPPLAGTDLSQSTVFHAGFPDTIATNLNGNVIWYYDWANNKFPAYAANLEPGGTVMLLGGKATGVAGGEDTFRQIDLAGDTLRQTSIYAINAQLAKLHKAPIIDFDHEAKLLPNGATVLLASTQKTVKYKGKPTKFTGDEVIVLNQNLHVTWTWDSFTWLNTNRLGTDGPSYTDWLHGNAVSWSPNDQDLIVSLRNQDWVVKIDYDNGKGNGHVIWKLGADGNFKPIAPNTPLPWFSHQHDARYINGNTLLIFDDGNTRHDGVGSGDSRGQEWVINQRKKTATLVVNADMGNYSSFLGSAEMLSNGNLAFTSGAVFGPHGPQGQSIEVLTTGTRAYVQQESELEYRSYFETNLYTASELD
jgi:hypothetical protein